MSLKYYLKYIIISPKNYSLSGNILVNAYSWFEDGLKSGFISFFIIVGILISVYNYIKHLKKNEYIYVLNLLLLYLFPILCFLFFFVTKKNWATQAMIFPILILFILINVFLFIESLTGNSKKIALVIVTLLVALQVWWQNEMNELPSVFEYYTSRNDLATLYNH